MEMDANSYFYAGLLFAIVLGFAARQLGFLSVHKRAKTESKSGGSNRSGNKPKRK